MTDDNKLSEQEKLYKTLREIIEGLALVGLFMGGLTVLAILTVVVLNLLP